jgi:signal transduction histidine kinase
MYPRHRWAVVFGSIFFIGLVEAVSDSLLDPILPLPLRTALVVATVAAVALVAAWFAFRLIDRLMRNLLRRHHALRHRNAALAAVYQISLAIAGQQDPDRILATVVEHARRLLRVDAALIVLAGEDGSPTVCAASGDPRAIGDCGTAPRDGDEACGVASSFVADGYAVGLEVPVGAGSACEGSLAVVSVAGPDRSRRHSLSDSETLLALATEAGLALEAARLRDELKAVAVQRERERIAREMHDGMAQVLAYVNAKSQAVDELLATGRVAEAGKQMQELAAASRSLYVDVREAILSLSPPTLPERGLAPALRDYAERFAESSKIAVRFEASEEARRAALKPEVGAEVFGVAREALTNVRKHAHANRVSVELSVEAGELLLRIADDGVGFDAEAASSGPEKWPHFGLAGMRERAEAVGGLVRWLSRTGSSGSIVELRIPILSGTQEPGLPPLDPPGGAATRRAPRQTGHSSGPTHSEAD